ncbi:MAG: hypothetical protein LC624_07695 [Halobacteriales archaeon]|nr:hypothetical protein [Halobacteriales archaeon]
MHRTMTAWSLGVLAALLLAGCAAPPVPGTGPVTSGTSVTDQGAGGDGNVSLQQAVDETSQLSQRVREAQVEHNELMRQMRDSSEKLEAQQAQMAQLQEQLAAEQRAHDNLTRHAQG